MDGQNAGRMRPRHTLDAARLHAYLKTAMPANAPVSANAGDMEIKQASERVGHIKQT